MTENKIKVLLIDDSPIVLNILKRILGSSPEVTIIGTANNGAQGLEDVRLLNPDVICTDLMMPVMDGLEFTKQLMETNPKPILVISAALQGENETNVFQLLEAGALDIFPKPSGGTDKDYDLIRDRLVSKIRVIKSVPVYKKNRKTPTTTNTSTHPVLPTKSKQDLKILAIGSSTGGPNALLQILGKLPKEFPIPILCVQHISDGFIDSLVGWLGQNSKLKIKIMQEGEIPVAGTVYFPQNGKHMVIIDGRLQISNEPAYNGHCPSVNVMFKSVAKFSGNKSLAVILTGMGDDGATGLLTIKHMGGITIGEAESTCVVYGMPKVAKEIGAVEHQLPVDKIASHILGIVQ